MWYEKLDVQFDIERLKKDVREHVFTLSDQVTQGLSATYNPKILAK